MMFACPRVEEYAFWDFDIDCEPIDALLCFTTCPYTLHLYIFTSLQCEFVMQQNAYCNLIFHVLPQRISSGCSCVNHHEAASLAGVSWCLYGETQPHCRVECWRNSSSYLLVVFWWSIWLMMIWWLISFLDPMTLEKQSLKALKTFIVWGFCRIRATENQSTRSSTWRSEKIEGAGCAGRCALEVRSL